MIINSHVHINTNRNYFFYNDYVLERFLQEMQENNIDLAFPALNPKLEIFRCPNDCSMQCVKQKKGESLINNNLNDCDCNYPNRHRTGIIEEDGYMAIRCKTCGKTILSSDVDALRKYNEELIRITKPYRRKVKPLIYVLLCESTMQSEINFFEENYGNEFVGFKLHPWNDQVSVADFKLNTTKPILIHTGVRRLESARNAITFAKNNPETRVVIAHAAALDKEALKQIAVLDNVYIDCCPSSFMYESRYDCLFSPEEIQAPQDIYYKALEFLPSDKILFGTDSPWGNSKQELMTINNLQVPERVKNQILFENAKKVYL